MRRDHSTDHRSSSLRLRTTERPAPKPAGEPSDDRRRRTPATSLTEATARYDAARDAWIAAMRAAGSGRPADMASLALAQEEYELATAERDRWLTHGAVAIPIDPEPRRPIDAIVGQELAWRQVHEQEEIRHRRPAGLLGRLFRRGGREGR